MARLSWKGDFLFLPTLRYIQLMTESAEGVIPSIVGEVEVVQKEPPKNENYFNLISYYELSSGNKRLTLAFDNMSDHVWADTRISSVKTQARVEGSTTSLYRKAAEMMQDIADRMKVPVFYMLSTKNRKMKKWAQDPEKGRAIFNWNNIDKGKELIARIWIKPKTVQS